MQPTTFLPGTQIEIVTRCGVGGGFRAALFDFDGTLSLIRRGWQDIMIPMMVDVLAETPQAEARDGITAEVKEYVTRLTGEQTIYQMAELARQVALRGGEPLDPLEYKRQYHARLMDHIGGRREALRSGRVDSEEMLVPGSVDILAALRGRGIDLYCASGTDEPYMREEAEMLGIAPWFDGRLYGALDEYERFSKGMVIQRILRDQGIAGSELVAFGDGFVEIECTRQAGGTAVGVASDERRRQGIDAWKRDRLISAGAHVIVPDFREADALTDYLSTGGSA